MLRIEQSLHCERTASQCYGEQHGGTSEKREVHRGKRGRGVVEHSGENNPTQEWPFLSTTAFTSLAYKRRMILQP